MGEADIGSSGCFAAYAVATDNLFMGLRVVADSVSLLNITRNAWENVTTEERVELVEIEVVCTNRADHHRRIGSRTADISDHALPDWKSVIER
ncbi:MAG: putative kinase [Solimicrobium sp.]|jgi:predicted kinase|nr:putative kinase [Solimicrobium sp.]